MNVTDVPMQTGLELAMMETLTGRLSITFTVMLAQEEMPHVLSQRA